MSLPYQDIPWHQFDQGAEKIKGLRIGLLLEAGCGMAVEPEIRAAVEHAAACSSGPGPWWRQCVPS